MLARYLEMSTRRRWAIASIAVVLFAAVAAEGWAYIVASSTSGSAGAASATSLPAGNTPAPAKSGRDVTVQWAQNTVAFAGGLLGANANGGYTITRYAESGGGAITPASACNSLQQGNTDPLSCTENSLPTGRWQYTATPNFYNWAGVESSRSSSVTIAPDVPTSVALVNGGGIAPGYVDGANQDSLSIDVTLPTTSLSSDTVTLTLSDGVPADTVTRTAPGITGGGTRHFTGVDASGLADGTITIAAEASSSYGDNGPSTSISRTKDTVDPTVNVTAARPPDSGGWYSAPVTFSASTSTDDRSGIQACDADVAYSGPDTGSGSQSFTCTDNAGNTASNAVAFKYDATSPSSSASGNDSNWHSSDVTVHLSATDPNGSDGSGVSTITYQVDAGPVQTISGSGGDVVISAPADHSGDGQHTISFHAADIAGNQETPANSITVKIDTTKPATAAGGADSSWHNTPVTVHLAGSDPGYPGTGAGVSNLHYQVDAQTGVDVAGASGVASADVTVPAPADGSDDGSHTIAYYSTDAAGNVESSGSVTVKIDATKPTITASATTPGDTPYTAGDWANETVTVHYACADTGGSLLATCTSDQVFSTTGVTASTSGTATDTAGNSDTATFGPIMIDKLAPSGTTLTTSPAANGNGWITSAPATITLSGATDTGGSGVALVSYTTDGSDPTSSGTAQTYDSGAKPQVSTTTTFKYAAQDAAGNWEAVHTATVQIDTTPPAQSLSLTGATSNVYLSGSGDSWTLAFDGPSAGLGTTGGSFKLVDTVAETDSGIAPNGVTFPGNSTGSHWATTSANSCSSSTCTSNAYSWSVSFFQTPGTPSNETITATDNAGHTDTVTLHFVNDTSGPESGSVSVPSLATGSVPVTFSASDSGSGIDPGSGSLLRRQATYSSGHCNSYGSYSTVTGSTGATSPFSDGTVTTGHCYEYEYRVSDNLGNGPSTFGPSNAVVVTTPAAPSITSASADTFDTGAAGTFAVTTTGVPTASITNAAFGACTPSALPGTLSFTDNGDGTATLSGTPTAAATYTLCLNASNGVGSDAHQTFTLTVTTSVGATLLNSTSSTSSGHATTTGSVTTTNNGTVLILVERRSNLSTTDAITSIAGPFTGVTQIGSNFHFQNNWYLWAYRATGNGSSGAVTVNFNATGSNSSTVVNVVALSGNDTAAPVAQSQTNSGSDSSAEALLTSPNAANGEIVFAGTAGASPTNLTRPSGTTQLDTGNISSGFVWGSYLDQSAQSSETVTISANHPWGTIAIEINHG